MEDSTQGWTQLGLFFPKSGHFFRFSKKGRGGLPYPLPLAARLQPTVIAKLRQPKLCRFESSYTNDSLNVN